MIIQEEWELIYHVKICVLKSKIEKSCLKKSSHITTILQVYEYLELVEQFIDMILNQCSNSAIKI